MPLLTVNVRGAKLHYVDSGPPPNSENYTTLVFVHGTMFTSGIFSRLLKHLDGKPVRLVFVNRRDYTPSSAFSKDELAKLDDDIDGWQCERGLEIAAFLSGLVEAHGLPPACGNTGGIVLVGWSSGGTTSNALLAHADAIPAEQRQCLERYLRRLILFDPPHFVFGFPDRHIPTFAPWLDPAVPQQEKASFFLDWVTGYYQYHSYDTLEDITTDVRSDKPPSVSRMAPEELGVMIDPIPATVNFSDTLDRPDRRDALNREAQLTFFDETRACIFSGCKITVLWCNASAYPVPQAIFELKRQIAETSPARKLDIVEVDGQNHFFMWDEPKLCLKWLMDISAS